jgi:WD40 repeat protein
VLIIWDLNGNALRRYQAHREPISTVMYDPTDPTTVMTAALDGTIRQWRADDLDTLLTWTQDNRDIRILSGLECENYELDDPALATRFCEDNAPAEDEEEVSVVDADIQEQ